MAHTRRLYKSSDDKLISGIAGGMAEYFGIDPVFVRLGWIASVFITGGLSILIYIVMIFVVPKGEYGARRYPDASVENGAERDEARADWNATERKRKERARDWLAVALIAAGVVLLFYNLDILGPIDWSMLAAISVIGVGVTLLVVSIRRRR